MPTRCASWARLCTIRRNRSQSDQTRRGYFLMPHRVLDLQRGDGNATVQRGVGCQARDVARLFGDYSAPGNTGCFMSADVCAHCTGIMLRSGALESTVLCMSVQVCARMHAPAHRCKQRRPRLQRVQYHSKQLLFHEEKNVCASLERPPACH